MWPPGTRSVLVEVLLDLGDVKVWRDVVFVFVASRAQWMSAFMSSSSFSRSS